jgi:predicted DNA-binding transcriptional regulator AlpA
MKVNDRKRTREELVTITGQALIDIGELETMFMISRVHAWRLVKSGKLKSVKIGKCLRFTIDEVNRFINQSVNQDVA